MANWLAEISSTSLAVVGQNFGNNVKSITAVKLFTDVANCPLFPKVFWRFTTSSEELPTICNKGKQIKFSANKHLVNSWNIDRWLSNVTIIV